FVDDYFNCLTVGSVMSPVTDQHKLSRSKLAYIIDATAAPVCMIAPISSWAAAVTGVAADLNVDGIQLFIKAIPYNFYSLFTIVFVIALVIMGFDYGPMAAAEIKALKENDLGVKEGTMVAAKETKATLWDMLIPIIVLIIMCVLGMVYVGGFWDAESEGFHNLILSFGNTDAFVALPWGSLVALLFAIIYLMARRVIDFKGAMDCIIKGFNAMVPALLILTFAVTLKSMTGLLGADMFVKGLMEGAAKGLFAMLPAVIFVVACFMAFATGTSWGTFGILIPIVLPIFENDPQLLIIGISACLAGAVCGDHCSPISDTTIMASAGAGCDHVQHVSTQIPYAVTVAAISFVNYIVAGFVHAWYILLPLGIILTLATLFVIKAITAKKTA
ncbi:MAG: Na+/H+ antiporter NhaC family protein, partial [Clostridia bacterium]|nr:Na+/H+ antiporter NhaC family protein [Clostridia bacterium]